MNPAVTIVLPVHNVERTLRPAVMRMLDLAEIMSRRIRVAVVDDGSTDGTYEAACELSREFPQVCILRQPFQRGLGGALEQVRARLGVTHVVAHDGAARIDLDDLAEALSAPAKSQPAPTLTAAALEGRGSRRSPPAAMAALNAPRTERSSSSFRWLRLDEPLMPRPRRAPPVNMTPAGLSSALAGQTIAASTPPIMTLS